MPPVHLSSSVVLERVVLAIFIAISGALAYGTATGLVLPLVTPFAATVGLIFSSLLLVRRFQSLPEVKQKRKIRAELKNTQAELAKNEGDLKRLSADKSRLDQDEQRRISELTTKQHDCDHNERRESEEIDRELQRILASLNSQQQSLYQAESNEIAQARQTLQKQSYISSLTSYDISNAKIPGIGSELKKRLSARGIRTAADIVNIHVVLTGRGRHTHETAYIEIPGGRRVHVAGIGSVKASALLSWCQRVQTQLGSQTPQSLPLTQEAAIKTKYRAQRQSLGTQETRTKQEAQQKKERAREKYQRDREALAKQLHGVRDQFAKSRLALDQKLQQKNLSEKRWILERTKRSLQVYHQANFSAYLKRILFL